MSVYQDGVEERDRTAPSSRGTVLSNRKPKKQPPQETMQQFWSKFNTKYPGKVMTVLPDNRYAGNKAAKVPKGVVQGQIAVKSYEQAKRECVASVEKLVRDCRRVNKKYRDPHFDIEFDLKCGPRDCLRGLSLTSDSLELQPRAVKRIYEIFSAPEFYKEGATSGDIRQGLDGDCWFLAALSTLSNKEGLIERVCVAKDEKVGVYGFVFHRGMCRLDCR